MTSNQKRVYSWMGVAVALNWLLMIALVPNATDAMHQDISVGVLYGSLFSQTTIAAAWAAFGPGRLILRISLSLLWVAALTAVFGLFSGLQGESWQIGLIFGALSLGQWLVLQIPLWGLVLSLGVHLRHADTEIAGMDARIRQFSLRQLLIVTAVIGLLFGVGRVLVSVVQGSYLVVVIFLVLAEVVFVLPLLLAALLRRWTVAAVVLAIVVAVLAAACEYQLVSWVFGSGPQAGHRAFVAINVGTAAMLLLFLSIVRFSGYSLATTRGKS